jgi:ATP-binding cassette subfamily B (MDR/TAP) protein 9
VALESKSLLSLIRIWGTDPSLTQPLLGEDVKTTKSFNATLGSLLSLSRPDVPYLTLGFIGGCGSALGNSLIPYYSGKIVDAAAIEHDHDMFFSNIKLLAVSAVFCAATTGLRGGSFTMSAARLNVRIRRTLMQSLLCQEVGFFELTRTGDITSRLTSDTTTMSDQVSLNLNVLMRSLVQMIIVLFFMFASSWKLTCLTFVTVPITVMLSKTYGAFYRKLAKQAQSELAEVNNVAEEAISSMSTIKSVAAERLVQSEFDLHVMGYFHLQRTESFAYSIYAIITTILPNLVNVLVLLYGGHLVLEHEMSAGALVSFMYYQQSLSSAFQAIGDIFTGLAAAVGAADKVFELMGRKPQLSSGGTACPEPLKGDLEFQNVDFAYITRPDMRVLRGFTLKVPAGQVCALVGPSGGGKSSVIKLMERFYAPTSGQVLLDGRPLGDYNHTWMRRKLTLVGQEPVLYARSIRRNIIFGLESDAEVSEVERARLQLKAEGRVEAEEKEGKKRDWWAKMRSSRDVQVNN